MREQPFLPARQEHDVELEALGGVQRHQRDAVAVVALLGVHDQRDVLEEAGQRLELVHEADELLQVLQPRLRLRALVGLPHRRVAALVEDQLGQLGVLQLVDAAPRQRSNGAIRSASDLRALPASSSVSMHLARGLEHRDAAGAAPARGCA